MGREGSCYVYEMRGLFLSAAGATSQKCAPLCSTNDQSPKGLATRIHTTLCKKINAGA